MGIIGLLLSIEALAALLWPRNDKQLFAQGVRVLRLLLGSILMTKGSKG